MVVCVVIDWTGLHCNYYFLDEIIMHEGVTAVYKSNVDLFFCVLGAQNENEVITVQLHFHTLPIIILLKLMLVGVLTALYDTISQLLK